MLGCGSWGGRRAPCGCCFAVVRRSACGLSLRWWAPRPLEAETSTVEVVAETPCQRLSREFPAWMWQQQMRTTYQSVPLGHGLMVDRPRQGYRCPRWWSSSALSTGGGPSSSLEVACEDDRSDPPRGTQVRRPRARQQHREQPGRPTGGRARDGHGGVPGTRCRPTPGSLEPRPGHRRKCDLLITPCTPTVRSTTWEMTKSPAADRYAYATWRSIPRSCSRKSSAFTTARRMATSRSLT